MDEYWKAQFARWREQASEDDRERMDLVTFTSLQRGLEDASEGNTKDLGDFTDDDPEEVAWWDRWAADGGHS